VTRSIDIWSLGCVFSIAATWVVLGYEGIRQFARFREHAVRKLLDQQEATGTQNGTMQSGGDFFHDGENVLEDIYDWHKFVRRYLRHTDKMTGEVLDLVEKHMLKTAVKERIEAKELTKKLQGLFPKEPQPKLLPTIMQALLQIDDEAPSRPAASRQENIQFAKDLLEPLRSGPGIQKSNQLNLPLYKTTHRSDYLRSALRDQGILPDDGIAGRAPFSPSPEPPKVGQVLYDNRGYANRTAQTPHRRQESMDALLHNRNHTYDEYTESGIAYRYHHGHAASTSGVVRTVTAPPQLGPQLGQHKPRNVYQTREELEKGHKSSLWPKKRGKDSFLAGYFQNRDIVSPHSATEKREPC
jgi:hypothetical protein